MCLHMYQKRKILARLYIVKKYLIKHMPCRAMEDRDGEEKVFMLAKDVRTLYPLSGISDAVIDFHIR